MGEIKVQIVPNKLKSLQLNSKNIKTPIEIEENPTHYYSTLAKQWAVLMNGMVQDEDYSSKYWANQSKQWAETSIAAGENAANLGNLLNENYTSYSNDLQQTTKAGIESIQLEQENILTEIDEAKQEINTATIKSIEDITETKLNSINKIDNEANTQINNIKSTGFYMQDGKLYYIDENGEPKEYISASGSSLPLGAPVVMDRILSFEESKGLALQGTYVYKNAATGRYGYADFYEKYTAAKSAGTPTQVTLGDSTITMYVNTNGLTFYDIADKAVIDNFFNTYGIADYYGVDTENERIFLPRNNYFWQFTTDTTKVNQFNKAGLPNATGSVGTLMGNPVIGQSGGLSSTHLNLNQHTTGGGGDLGWRTLNLDLSQSNPTYGNSDTVQPPSSNKLLYYVVGNTEQETAITDVVDITSSANDTLPEFYNFYSDEDMTVTGAYVNASLGSWLSGTLYETSYNKLVQELTNPVAGRSVKSYTDTYNEYDFVINQDNITFRLPICTKQRVLVAKKDATADDNRWYNLYSDGWCEQGGRITTQQTVTYLRAFKDKNYNLTFGNGSPTSYTGTIQLKEFGWYGTNGLTATGYTGTADANHTKDWCARGYTAIPQPSEYNLGLNLYFKLGNALQNQDIINVAEVLSALNLKADIDLSNINAAAQLTIANLACPDMGSGITLSNGSASNPYNYPYPVMFYGTQANMQADSVLYISTTKNGTTYTGLNGGVSGQGRRQSFSWLIPANYNFYISSFETSKVFPLIGGNH